MSCFPFTQLVLVPCPHFLVTCRLFLCGTSRNGELHLVEWNEIEGSIKRLYNGTERQCFDDVHFDTTNNQFLVAVDESVIKFWDMNDVNLMMTVNVGKGLPVNNLLQYPRLAMFFEEKSC